MLAAMNELYINLWLSWVKNFDILFSAFVCRGASLHISDLHKSNYEDCRPKIIPNTLWWSFDVFLHREGEWYINPSVQNLSSLESL